MSLTNTTTHCRLFKALLAPGIRVVIYNKAPQICCLFILLLYRINDCPVLCLLLISFVTVNV